MTRMFGHLDTDDHFVDRKGQEETERSRPMSELRAIKVSIGMVGIATWCCWLLVGASRWVPLILATVYIFESFLNPYIRLNPTV